MKLEQQVVSLELAQKMDKLGIRKPSLYVWWYTEAMSTDVKYFPDQDWNKRENTLRLRTENMKDSGRDISAYTVAELGLLLPNWIQGDLINQLPYKTLGSKWRVDLDDEGMLCSEDTEADARAKMLIYLVENKIITL